MTHDLLIIGGGINGCAIAREAALNGWSVMLVEKDDLAGHTSSASTKLIHGGLRYLETYEFGMVRKALQERGLLLGMAPHIIHPLRIVLPHVNAIRPWWLVRAGLLIYDFLAGIPHLPIARGLRKKDKAFQAPLQKPMRGFVYSDCAVDDARLTILNAVDAAQAGAQIVTRTGFVSAKAQGGQWQVTLSDGRIVQAKVVINAAGPWVSLTEGQMGLGHRKPMKLVRGSHIVVPRLYDGDHAYMLQQPDKRIIFVINWAHDTTMIGTTEEDVQSPEDEQISAEETRYLLDATNRLFAHQSSEAEIVYRWGGIRPLVDNGVGNARQTTRDYVLETTSDPAPSLTVYGGKITTARYLAEDAVQRIASLLGKTAVPASRTRPFPGGDIGADFIATVAERWPFLGPDRAQRMGHAYGSLINQILGDAKSADDLGADLGAGLTAREVDWLVSHEWAQTAEDILWRRTKLGLVATAADVAKLTRYLEEKAHAARD
jgi:glycerol-3-phosphate dehydrogenase